MGQPLPDDLIDAVYRAALEPAAWSDVIELMRGSFPSSVQAFYLLHLEPRRVEPVCVVGLDTRWLQSFDELYFSPENPWMRVSQFLHRPGVVRTTERLESFLGDPGVLYRSTYYHEWMKPQGFKHNIGNTLLSEHGLVANVTLFRPPDMPTFDETEVVAFQRLSTHMTRALQMSLRLQQPSPGGASAAALDAVPQAIALLDERRGLLYANAAMETLLRRRQGLRLCSEALHAVDSIADVALAASLRDARSPRRGAADAPAPLMLPCGNDERLIVRVMPLAAGSTPLSSRAATLLLASPCRPRASPSHVELRHLYGFTDAEARLVRGLLEGRELRDAALSQGTTYGTARGYLKIVFQKAGVHTQAQLVSKLLGDAAARQAVPDTLH